MRLLCSALAPRRGIWRAIRQKTYERTWPLRSFSYLCSGEQLANEPAGLDTVAVLNTILEAHYLAH